jgi:hypothetical protein
MNHFTEEELVLWYYGERSEDAADEHLVSCEACRAGLASVTRVLDAMDGLEVPEPLSGLDKRVWQKIEPQLAESGGNWRAKHGWTNWFAPRRLAAVAAMAVLVVAAFLAGRVSQRRLQVAGLSGPVRERIMLVAVGEHLEQSQMILVELMNNESKGTVDISEEQTRAQDLIDENRLYRQAALRTGDRSVSNVLDELERVLLEVAHSPSKLNSAEFEQIRQRIEADGILFKIRVVGSNLKEREAVPVKGRAL